MRAVRPGTCWCSTCSACSAPSSSSTTTSRSAEPRLFTIASINPIQVELVTEDMSFCSLDVLSSDGVYVGVACRAAHSFTGQGLQGSRQCAGLQSAQASPSKRAAAIRLPPLGEPRSAASRLCALTLTRSLVGPGPVRSAAGVCLGSTGSAPHGTVSQQSCGRWRQVREPRLLVVRHGAGASAAGAVSSR